MGDCTSDGVKRLEEVGFLRVGSWEIAHGEPTFILDVAQGRVDQGVLYAFVCGRAVLYLGKTTQPLRKRLHGYQRPGASQRTNIAARARIVEMLGAEHQLEIYAFFDNGGTHYGGLKVNVAAGLEDALIRELQPAWNRVGR